MIPSMNTVEETSPNLISVLEDLGYRITQPRRELIAFLSKHDSAFTAEEIAAESRHMGRATVYRTLKLLVEGGVLCKTITRDGSPRYSLGDTNHHHHHLICVQCGRVEEFRHPAVERMLRSMKRDISGNLIGHRLEIYDQCEQCIQTSLEN